MAANASATSVTPDTLITVKITVNDSLKKLKLPLRDLGADVLVPKLRHLLAIKPDQVAVFERFSDSAGGYITLDPDSPQVFKTLIRAAKAKLKLRLKATVNPLSDAVKKEEATTADKRASSTTTEPGMVRSPVYQAAPRDSTALDRRSIGSGIFEFREARSSQQTLVDTSEAPIPRPFNTGKKDGQAIQRELAFRNRAQPLTTGFATVAGHPWSVYCNACDVAMADAHFHCSICDGGDYDLCERCVAAGTVCPGEGHWLIKRFIRDGKVINSTTERVEVRKMPAAGIETLVKEDKCEMPGAFKEDATAPFGSEKQPSIPLPTRTCNSCVVVLPESEFVTCSACDDFDLCLRCHTGNKHGHHPAHGFHPATEETVLPLAAQNLLAPGRNVRHNAICDGCDKKILGVRHKCLNCPDWDFCDDCIKNARITHPRHRFAAIYAPIGDVANPLIRHYGIYCDGPLCSAKAGQSYITGVRYKCAVCHDTDFCAACEAIPSNEHNRTHPLIKFKTPVRNVSITTENEDIRGNTRVMGDRRGVGSAQTATRSASTETVPVQQSNAATQVQTMAEIFPTQEKEAAPAKAETTKRAPLAPIPAPFSPMVLNAHFVKDSIPDGTVIQSGARFTQVWTMRNPGPHAWPAGCSVRFIGGDNMLNVDNTRPAAVSDIAEASESNVAGREIQVGETVGFRVTLKAPMREGKAISYWRMKSADGAPFGHRLWCDIEVKQPKEEAPAPVVQTAPAVPQMYNTPFNGVEQAQLSRMQAIRQKQTELQQQRMMVAQQAMQQSLQAAQKQALESLGQPPAYDASQQANVSARIAAMREQQAKRREEMIAKFHAGREREAQIVADASKQQTVKEEEEKARKEAARARVEHIKAKILRAREETAKAMLAKKHMEHAVEVKKAEEEPKENLEGSQMVFPKLEHQSPASSTYESATSSSGKGKAAYVENEAGEVERSAGPSPVPIPVLDIVSPSVEEDFEHLDNDIEVLSANGEESDDDSFLTDEEYDILDASDHETVASK